MQAALQLYSCQQTAARLHSASTCTPPPSGLAMSLASPPLHCVSIACFTVLSAEHAGSAAAAQLPAASSCRSSAMACATPPSLGCFPCHCHHPPSLH
eukprot:1156268-Pelagomonas_calceolata.AAC.6